MDCPAQEEIPELTVIQEIAGTMELNAPFRGYLLHNRLPSDNVQPLKNL